MRTIFNKLPLLFFLLWSAQASANFVNLLDYGSWISNRSSHGIHTRHFWVDLQLPKGANPGTVGIIYTTDDWQSSQKALASFESSFDAGSDKWGVDVTIGSFSNYKPGPVDVEFSIFYESNGEVLTDGRRSYSVYKRPTDALPVRFVQAKPSYDPVDGGKIVGHVRAKDFGRLSFLNVYYSVDKGETYKLVDARWQSFERWGFEIKDLGVTDLPEEVQFYFEYSNGRGNIFLDGDPEKYTKKYFFRFHPQITSKVQVVDNLPIVGVSGVSVNTYTSLAIESIESKIDDQPWQKLRSGFGTIDSRELSEGSHTMSFRVFLEGGYVAYGDTQTFLVARSLKPSGETVLYPESNYYLSIRSSKLLDDGTLMTQWSEYGDGGNDRRDFIERYESLDALAPEWRSVEFEDEIIAFASNAQGESWLLTMENYQSPKSLVKLDAKGQVDNSFADSGKLVLSADDTNGKELCSWIPNMEYIQGHIFILDSCQDTIFAFDNEGKLAQQFKAEGVRSIDWDRSNKELNLVFHDKFQSYTVSDSLQFALVQENKGESTIGLQYFDKEGDSYWTFNSNVIRQHSLDGKVLAHWQSSGNTTSLGDLSYTLAGFYPSADGSIATIANLGGRKSIVRFVKDSDAATK